jgi:PhoPQ-activated pathogenicity-related protein
MSYLTLFVLCFVGLCGAYDWDQPTALDRYVHLDDGFFTWSEIGQYRFDDDNVTVYLLNMTSQKWMDETVTNHPVWWHMMGVGIPDVIREDVSYLYIEGGSNGPGTEPPDMDDGVINAVRLYARMTGYVASFLKQVPNQSIVFANDPSGEERSEDEIIAWTWRSYVTDYTDTPEIIARMPMTKSVIRAMDAITEAVAERRPGHDVQRFIVGGGSKRGWTTWSAAATDKRVIACTPMVMSLLNFNDTLQAHYRNLGGAWSIAFYDYYSLNLTSHIHDDQVTNWEYGLWTYEDMFRYKERLALIPKLLISATGDEFFLLTDTLTWWDDMYGDKWIMMNQNAEHSLSPWYIKIGETVASWSMLLLEGPPVPKLDWQIGDTGHSARVSLFVDQIPDNITGWYAYTWKNETRKDFRLAVGYPPYIHPIRWYKTDVTDIGNGQYEVELETPESGFGGLFIECIWTRLNGIQLHLTTQVQVTPDIYPAESCYGEECYGYLI